MSKFEMEAQAEYIERLEDAIRKLYINQLVGCGMSRDKAKTHADSVLEQLKNK